MPNINLEASTKQIDFIKSTSKGTIFEGGIGSGKTRILCRKAIMKALRKRRFGLVSFSYRTLYDVVLNTMKEELNLFELKINKDYKIYESDMIVEIFGTEILLRSGDRPDSLRGLNLDDFGIDEGREFKNRLIFDIMLGRIRNSADAQWFIATTTKGRNWIHKLYTERPAGINVINQSTYESPFLPSEYVKELEARYTSDFIRQELLAEIVEFGAGIINPNWFKKIPYIKPDGGVRYWDLAVSIKTSADYSCGARMTYNNKILTLHDLVHGKFEYPDLKKRIIACAHNDGTDVIIGIEEAGQQLGFIDDLKRTPELAGYIIRNMRPVGDKLNRALPWMTKAETGNFHVCEGHWNELFFQECASFSADDSHEHDDMVDAVSGSSRMLIQTAKATAARIAF